MGDGVGCFDGPLEGSAEGPAVGEADGGADGCLVGEFWMQKGQGVSQSQAERQILDVLA